jgi:hypothetical protein
MVDWLESKLHKDPNRRTRAATDVLYAADFQEFVNAKFTAELASMKRPGRKSGKGGSISVSTATKWLHELGYSVDKTKGGAIYAGVRALRIVVLSLYFASLFAHMSGPFMFFIVCLRK